MVPLKSRPLVGAILMEVNDEWIQGCRYIGIVSAFRISSVWRFTRAVRAARRGRWMKAVTTWIPQRCGIAG
jgi:hypothetical protein